MQTNYRERTFEYRRAPDQSAAQPAHHAVIVVGAGPVGLCAAIDLARHGVPVVLLDDDCTLSTGSRAICFAKRTLEIFDRLGCGERMVEKGVSWNVGKVFLQDQLLYSFNLLPEGGHHRPAFINLQQYYAEGYLVDHALQLNGLDIRWKNKVIAIAQTTDAVQLTVETPDGAYTLTADYLIAADGSRSPMRGMMGLESKGQIFRDRFLIADVKMEADFPTERWFWFDPPFHRNQSVLLHRQPDNVWRIDFQLGWDADPVAEREPAKVIPRVQALLGKDVKFSLEWVSVYTFACMRMERFRHGRVLFAGDAAHGVSPFGARGANSGVQDADNLAWKLALVVKGLAHERLLDSYDTERVVAADENILNSTRSTDFITPKSDVSKLFRDCVLRLAKHHPFARKLVNSGRLSTPCTLSESLLNTPDSDAFAGTMKLGAPALDVPVERAGRAEWLLQHLGDTFTGVYFAAGGEVPAEVRQTLAVFANAPIAIRLVVITAKDSSPASDEIEPLLDLQSLFRERYDAQAGSFYLFRPDQHLCARWRTVDANQIQAALQRATAHTLVAEARHAA